MNTAQRIYDILVQAAKQPENASTIDVWSEVLGISEQGKHKKVAEVSLRLSMLHGEVELLSSQMEGTQIPEQVYGAPLRKVEAAITAQNLGAAWKSYKSHLSPEVLLSLRYNAALLGDQEQSISEEEIKSLLDEIEALEQTLTDSALSPEIVSFISKQLASIRQALGEYKIKGANAIKETVHKAAGELIENKELITPNKDSEEIGRLAQLWQRFTQMGDAIIKTDNVLESSQPKSLGVDRVSIQKWRCW